MIVYADFNCPYSYLASMHVDALLRAGHPIEWRAVERSPFLPVTGRRLDASGLAGIDAELHVLSELTCANEALPATPPLFVPNTKAAVVGYAEAVGAGVGDEVRRLLFEAYWLRWLDIGNPEVLKTLLTPAIRSGVSEALPLRQAGFAVSASRGPITVAAYHRIDEWQTGWAQTPTGITPTLVDGQAMVTGTDALVRLSAYLPPDQLRSTALTPAAA